MSSLPNSKSSFLRAARNCSALALAGVMVLVADPGVSPGRSAHRKRACC